MHDLILFIHKEQFERIQQEVDGKDLSVIFDGTTHLWEALAFFCKF